MENFETAPEVVGGPYDNGTPDAVHATFGPRQGMGGGDDAITHTPHNSRAINSMGLWLFIASEAALFSAFIYARYYLTGTDQPGELNIALGFVITAALLSSSLCAYLAERGIARGDRGRFLRFTLAAIVLGALFLVGVGLEWREAAHSFAPPDLYGAVFFSLTGLHAIHMVTGLMALLFVWVQGWRGR